MYKNLILVGSGNLINALGGFFYIIAVAKILSVEDYGKYSLLIATFILLAKFTELGTTSSFVTQSIKNSVDYSRALLVLKIIQTIGVTIATIPILYYYNMLNMQILGAFLIGYFGYAANDYLFALFQLNEKFVATTLVNALPAIFKGIAALILILYLKNASLTTSLYLYFIALLTSLFLIIQTTKLKDQARISVKQGIKNLAKFGFLGGLSQAINLGIPAINSNLIVTFGSFTNLGIFGLSEKISSIFSLASLSIFTVLLPNKAKEVKDKNKYSFGQVLVLSCLILVAMALTILLAKPVIMFLFGEKYLEAIPILYLMIISAGLTAISTFMDNYFYIVEKTKVLLGINLLRVVILVVTAIFLLNKFGIYGVAYANIITSLLVLITTALVIITFRF